MSNPPFWIGDEGYQLTSNELQALKDLSHGRIIDDLMRERLKDLKVIDRTIDRWALTKDGERRLARGY
ncbi:MAG TPA: hypothetical protein VHX92_04850 [Rhizomicrobium sp.]|jgi:hypothetical protein|nr:hypothetical protein [Rhizomicrobium sp.]